MEIYPAIDLMDGHAVRLRHGERDSRVVYEREPERLAARFAAAGARLLHVVDLDGAFAGGTRNGEAIERIAAEGVPFELGGGLRSAEAVEAALALGASRAVVGTLAWRDPEAVRELLVRHGERLVASLDARNGELRLSGWTEATGIDLRTAAGRLRELGFARFEFTAIERDGTLDRPDVATTTALAELLGRPVVASGGVSDQEDIALLAAVGDARIEAVIVGKALYEGRLDLGAALAVARAGGR